MNNYSVSLVGPAPWGFRLQGGKDFNMPLTISRLSDGGKAANANVGIGDVVLSIDGISADGMTHLEAQNKIKTCSGKLTMNLQRAPAAPKPDPVPVQQSAAKPAVNIPWQPTYSTSSNSPFNENAQEVAEGQRRGFRENQGDNEQQNGNPDELKNPPKRPPRKHVVYTNTEFYHPPTHSNHSKKRLIEDTEDWHPRTGTTQSRSFRILAQITGTEHMKEPEPENVKKTKECQTENGELSISTDLTNGLEAQHSHSVATQTCVIPDVSEQPSLLSAQRAEATSASSTITDPTLLVTISSARLSGPDLSASSHRRKLFFNNPLEALPKCAPHPPAAVHVLSLSSQVATVSKTASTYLRSSQIKTGSLQLSVPAAAKLWVNEADNKKITPKMKSMTTQTSEPLVFPVTPMEPMLTVQPAKSISVASLPGSFNTRKVPLENPLKSFPRVPPTPSILHPEVAFLQARSSAAAAVSTAVAIRARLSNHSTYRALLDALLITPIIKPPPLENIRPSRKSTSSLEMQRNLSDSPEPAQFTAYTAATVRSMPESPENGANKPVSASTTSAPAFKPTGPQYAIKTLGWQPSNQPAGGSGWTANSSARPGAAVPSEKSTVAPLTDENTLVQRAEHIPAGKRTPMCAQCNQVIRGPFLVALGKSWHPEEFNCAHCKTSMAYIGFVEEKGALYCEGCYEKFFAPDCARCQRKVLGEVINALKQTWHVSCFVCVACHKPIRNNVFHLEDGDPYCETDYYALFGTMCHGCEFPIEAGDRFLEALGHTWHDTCFVCSVCCESLEGQTFFSKKDKPLCKKHAHSVNI
ncbi:PDZ and LIM domain protein 5 isoform X4 [Hemicordylus capensis]|uniref:PDZ and LIM domain protein 5 isoform X4 n=1 Tax=Hemicordylus capensis TaxID=884348 RepID=UPI00230294C5|nr:PDZ and LIM domain protein 5 isoform X4 [Hemicordylus capensis]